MAAPATPPTTTRRFKILALDVDGTLLNRDGHLLPSTVAAVARAAAAGIRPVLCTGRRYRRARPVADWLGLDAPLVCNSGALVKDPFDGRTLWRADLDRGLAERVLDHFRRHDEPAISFIDHGDADTIDFLVAEYPTGRSAFDDYVHQNLDHAGIGPAWLEGPSSIVDHPTAHFHVCAVGSRADMLAFEAALLRTVPGRVRTFVQRSVRYSGTMCEILSIDASKWSAVLHLAELWGVGPDEICAVGDDRNDVPMIEGAGLGVAMGHAPPEVLAVADHVTGDHDSDGVARLVDEVLLA